MISGLQKMTLLDFPGKVACTVFLQGCNFRCPFCHNSDLLPGQGQMLMDKEGLLAFLKKRVGLLDGVCISGGEPTLRPELPELLARIKELGFAIKLDTNGTKPGLLKQLVADGLVDYVAMDIKNCPDRYADTAGVPGLALDKLRESIGFLLEGSVDYEFRTTVVEELHDPAAMEAIGNWLREIRPDRKAKKFFLQPYVDRDSVLCAGLHRPEPEKVLEMARSLEKFVEQVAVRGMD